jgi:hypothetical protein
VKIVAICRGIPGLGRVAPALALTQTLAATGPVTTWFASYEAGAQYLAACGQNVTDIGRPEGLFIDPVSPQALRVLELVEAAVADLVLVDGEFYLPTTLTHLAVPVVYLANPHDLIGTPNTFRRVNRLLLVHADAVLISSLACRQPRLQPQLVPDTPCLEVPALVKDVALSHCRATGPPRVLVSTGGGSLRSPSLRAATDQALAHVLDALAAMAEAGCVGKVSVVLGADATLPAQWRQVTWMTAINGPTELADLYPSHDLLIARAGRNTIAEAVYCRIPAILVPITADPHRACEQTDNANAVACLPGMFPLRNWRDPVTLRDTLIQAIFAAQRGTRRAGCRGNDSAASFVTQLVLHPRNAIQAPDLHLVTRGAERDRLGYDLSRPARHPIDPARR